jgi:hypothetical protein
MPRPSNPLRRDFYVYQFRVDGYPFYVGIGRAKRGTDRLRYVRSLLRPEKAPRLAKKSLSVRVMASLLRRNKESNIPARVDVSRAARLFNWSKER